MKKETTIQPPTEHTKRENELQALKNALDNCNLKGYEIFQSHTRKYQYCLIDDKGNYLTGFWNYVSLNHFIMGYGKALNKLLKADNEALKEANRELLEALKKVVDYFPHTAYTKKVIAPAAELISKHSVR